MKALQTLAKMLGVPAHQAEDALHSERAARAVLSRRNLFAAAGALAAGSMLVGGPLPLHVFSDGSDWFIAHSWADFRSLIGEHYGNPEFEDEVFAAASVQRAHATLGVCWDPETDEITDDSSQNLRLTHAQWAQREGRGYLCSVDF